MKTIIKTMAIILVALAITSSAYAEPTVVFTELPEKRRMLAMEYGTVEVITQTEGRYSLKDNIIEIHNDLTPEQEIETFYHEYGHYIWFRKLNTLQRRFWTTATLRNPYEPTFYSSKEAHSILVRRTGERRTTWAYITENFAESYMLAVLFEEFPPKGTRQYHILKNIIK